MFLLYINVGISSSLSLLADDCVLYRIIESDGDQKCLQSDLNMIFAWSQSWQMRFNVNKCMTLRCDRSSQSSSFTYFLDSVPLNCVTKHTYLGVLLTSSMSFSPHINNIVAKASKMLNLMRQNLSKCTKDVKSTAYLSLGRPILEYSSPVWDPYLLADTQSIEKVQRRAARWVSSDYGRFNSVTSMLNELQWPTLSSHQKLARLSTFFKIIHHLSMPSLPHYFIPVNRSTRHHHSLHYNIINPSVRINSYKYSFFPRTINEWNNLPANLIESTSLSNFQ